MDLQPTEQDRLTRLFQYCGANPHKLNDFEKGFIDSNYLRFINDEGGENGYFVSPKMWKIFARLEVKLKLDAY
jgi:hypothetical protein